MAPEIRDEIPVTVHVLHTAFLAKQENSCTHKTFLCCLPWQEKHIGSSLPTTVVCCCCYENRLALASTCYDACQPKLDHTCMQMSQSLHFQAILQIDLM